MFLYIYDKRLIIALIFFNLTLFLWIEKSPFQSLKIRKQTSIFLWMFRNSVLMFHRHWPLKPFLSDCVAEGAVASGPQQSPLCWSWRWGDARDGWGERPRQTLGPGTHTQPPTQRHHPPPSDRKSRPVLPPDPSQYPTVPGWRRRGRRFYRGP